MTIIRKLRLILVVLALLTLGLSASAHHLSVQDIVHNKELLSPQKLKQLQWIPESHVFTYISPSQELVMIDADSNEKKALSASIFDFTSTNFPEIHWIDRNSFWFNVDTKILIWDISQGTAFQANVLAADADNLAAFSPDKVAYTVGPNLFLSLQGNIRQISNYKEDEHVLNGHSVHRQEFGIDKGIFWSPQGNLLAYYRMDESMVDDYPFEDFQVLPLRINSIKYPMAGRKSHQVKLVVYNLSTEQEILINTGEPLEQYLTNVTWTPNEGSILINVLNREQNHLKTIKYDAISGEQEDIVWEYVTDKYINPNFAYYFSPKTPNRPLWCSRHEGWFQLFGLNLDTHELRQALEFRGDISACLGFNEAADQFFFTAFNHDYPAQHGFSYHPSSNILISLTANKEGSHSIIPSHDGELILDVFSSQSTPYQVDLMTKQGELLKTVHTSSNPLLEYEIGKIEMLRLVSADSQYELFGRMIYPPDFDSLKHYPAIVYVYGGPHVQLVQDSWLLGARLWEVMMAQKGYIVFSMDNRGSANRGLAFEQQSYCRLGTCEIEDQMQGVAYLKSQHFVDSQRIGVFGWSFGGYMSASLMLKRPDVFKVGVAGGAVVDWQDYEIMYGERFMKKPAENPEGYHNANLGNFINNLQGDLLLISGTHDDVVVPRHTKMLTAKAIEHAKSIDTFFYPYGKHHFNKASDLHMYQKINDYFDDRLKR